MISPAAVELAIRLSRAEFNRALAEADLPAIGSILSPDVMLVTGSDSAVLVGKKAQLLAWKREFGAADRTIYTRTPQSILVSGVEPIAMELGDWEGVTTGLNASSVKGAYSAKWRKGDRNWIIVAEMFVSLSAE